MSACSYGLRCDGQRWELHCSRGGGGTSGVVEDRGVEDGGVADGVGRGRDSDDGVPHGRRAHRDAWMRALKKRRVRGQQMVAWWRRCSVGVEEEKGMGDSNED